MNQHQSSGAVAGPAGYKLIEEKHDAYSHHNKPDEHEEKKEKFDEDISLEEALSTL